MDLLKLASVTAIGTNSIMIIKKKMEEKGFIVSGVMSNHDLCEITELKLTILG